MTISGGPRKQWHAERDGTNGMGCGVGRCGGTGRRFWISDEKMVQRMV